MEATKKHKGMAGTGREIGIPSYPPLAWRMVSIGFPYVDKLATFRLKQGDELSLGSPPREEDQLFSPCAQHRMDFHFPSITEIEDTVVVNAPTVRSLS